MIKGIWAELKRPIMVLAPMAGVTDTVFRQIVAKYGKPDLFFTEFVSCDGLCSEGRARLLIDLAFAACERPIIAQIFSATPDHFYRTAQLVSELGFDGIDINTGCPDKSVEKQGAGAALLKDPALTKRIVRETQRGANGLPVSVKTRLGYNRNVIGDWMQHLLEVEPSAITVHLRTRAEMSDVPAQWDAAAQAVDIRNQSSAPTLIIGNGDVASVAEAKTVAQQTGVDGVMIGRGIYGNPWLFNPNRAIEDVSLTERLDVLLEHARLFEATYGSNKNFAIMRKFFRSYVLGFPAAKNLRLQLMETKSVTDVERIVDQYRRSIEKSPDKTVGQI